jgi:hypothetical protein
MVSGYGGTYLGSVVDDADPLGERRLRVLVPEIYGDESVWAAASTTDDGVAPGLGESVWVSFEHGDTDHPVWQRPADATGGDTTGGGHRYIGKYRGRVVDNADPMQERRLNVIVPELGDWSTWATAGSEVEQLDVPEVGTEVWIEFEYGDPAYPRWVGLI